MIGGGKEWNREKKSIKSQDQRSGGGNVEQKCDGVGFKHYFGSRMM